jgi:hypothetical protein
MKGSETTDGSERSLSSFNAPFAEQKAEVKYSSEA